MKLPDNYQAACDWIDLQLTKQTCKFTEIQGVTINDLNHYLTNLKSRINNSAGFAQKSAFMQTKIIKDNLK